MIVVVKIYDTEFDAEIDRPKSELIMYDEEPGDVIDEVKDLLESAGYGDAN